MIIQRIQQKVIYQITSRKRIYIILYFFLNINIHFYTVNLTDHLYIKAKTLSSNIQQQMQSQQALIEQLNRKIVLLDEYACTLEKENSAKNNETSTLYVQLNDIRNENDILRSHLSRINQENLERIRRDQDNFERIKKEQSKAVLEKKNQSVKNSVQLLPIQENLQQTTRPHLSHTTISCQTQAPYPQQPNRTLLHHPCTQQITQLLQTSQQKDNKISQITKESQGMYEIILQLEQQNQQLRINYIEVENKFKTQAKQMKSYQIQIEDLRNLLNEERQNIQQERMDWQVKRENIVVEGELERLVRENNRLIQRVRMLEKEKNSFYAQLRGKNVSPLKTSQLSSRQNIPLAINNSSTKPSFTGIPYVSSDQKPQRFSTQFGIGKQKEKLKADRWRKIEEKISRVKEENEQLRANLVIN